MPVFRFGEFLLDTRSGELHRGQYRVRLRPQPAAVLEYLLQHPGEVVTREDLRNVLWPDGTFVHFDHGLNSCIKQLRAALLDDRIAPRYLETLPRRGYRFIGSVATEDGAAASSWAPQTAGTALSVVGTVRVDAGRVRVTLRLIDPQAADDLWAAEFDCDIGDVRGLQARIASEVMEGVAETLRGEPQQTVERTGQADAVMM